MSFKVLMGCRTSRVFTGGAVTRPVSSEGVRISTIASEVPPGVVGPLRAVVSSRSGHKTMILSTAFGLPALLKEYKFLLNPH